MEPNSTPTPDATNGATPKKFIRTFAGDMDTFQKGGIPDLAPFKETQPVQEESSKKEPSPDETNSIPLEAVPLPSEIITPTSRPKFESQTFVPAKPVEPVPEPAPVLAPKPMPAQLETYSSDFKDRMKETNASTATVLAAEQDATSSMSSVEEDAPRDSKNALYITAGFVLFLIGSIGVGFAYSRYLGAVAPLGVAPGTSTPIFVDSREEVSGIGVALQEAIKQSVGKPLTIHTVRLLSLATSTDASIFGSLSTRIPGILVRNIDPKGSMSGVVNVSSSTSSLEANSQSPFFILSVEAYSATFSGMLEWEPLMQSDLATIYPFYPAQAVVASSTGVSQATTTTPKLVSRTTVAKNNFRDEVVSNHDVRIYRDVENRSIILYGYWNEKTLVIARDPVAFAEILTRLATSYTN